MKTILPNNRHASGEFDLVSEYDPSDEQQKAIDALTEGIQNNSKSQVLLGVTGSGKTFTMANVIKNLKRPTLVMTHNKTLTAQLYSEFKKFFPNNAVGYFVSYYDYYQPEAYVPSKDLFIDKETSINDDLDKMRLAATRYLMERRDIVIVSSVSCIYGLGSPEVYSDLILYLKLGEKRDRQSIFKKLVAIQYKRNDLDFHRGTYRVRGDTIDVFPAEGDTAVRVEMFGDEIDNLYEFDPLTGRKLNKLSSFSVFPASHYVQKTEEIKRTLELIQEELEIRLVQLRSQGKLLEAQRLEQRTRYDLEIIEETGSCNGIENYSRIISRRNSGAAPPTLIDYFPKDSLLFVDESHAMLPQIRGMFHGDFSRKTTLIEHGFRLPSAIDNRPLKFDEFEESINQTVYVSATPADYEIEKSAGEIVEQIIRPTYLPDPVVETRPIMGQVDDLYEEILIRANKSERVLVTTLTKRMAEDLCDHYKDMGVNVKYMHSDIDALERTEILRDLRLGEFDVLIGINLLREGLDLPEVSLVAILDADKEGFLRSYRALIQTIGRAARNINGKVIMYADVRTDSMKKALDETNRRRNIQIEYNKKEKKTPTTIRSQISDSLYPGAKEERIAAEPSVKYGSKKPKNIPEKIKELEVDMKKAAKALKFEQAAEIRDEMKYWKELDLGIVE